jgi:hypothetical protein
MVGWMPAGQGEDEVGQFGGGSWADGPEGLDDEALALLRPIVVGAVKLSEGEQRTKLETVERVFGPAAARWAQGELKAAYWRIKDRESERVRYEGAWLGAAHEMREGPLPESKPSAVMRRLREINAGRMIR